MCTQSVVSRCNLCRNRIIDGSRHLARRKALPDQRIEAHLVTVQILLHLARCSQNARWADCLVRILCLLAHCVDIGTCRDIVLAVFLTEKRPRFVHGKIGDTRRIRSHIGDKTRGTVSPEYNALIELLGDHHRTAGGKAELACRILLERARCKRRSCLLAAFAPPHLLDGKLLPRKVVSQLFRLRLTVQRKFLAVRMCHVRHKYTLALLQLCLNRPVLFGLECLDLTLPITDQAYGHRLNTSGGQPLAHFAPEKRRQLIADDTIEHTSCLLRIHLLHVNGARVPHCFLNRRLCDLMEDNPTIILRVDPKDVRQMPCNRLPLTVGIACEIDLIRILGLFFECADEVALAAHINVFRRKFIFDIDAELALRQIAQMSHGGSHNVVFSKMSLNRLCLCRRLHNHENFFR